MKTSSEKLVSIIMPAYNCEDYILKSIESVINQIYKNWELIIIDDCSEDGTSKVVKKLQENENRIKYRKLKTNSGAAAARNEGVKLAKGEFIAFLDSDDLWKFNKLTKQVKFMEENNINFSCTSYDKIDQNGKTDKKIVHSVLRRTYKDLLKNNCGNSTVMYNCEKLGKTYVPDIRKRNDYLMWLQILKKEKYLYGINEVLSSHRIRENSLSKNKLSLIKYHWEIYRRIEKIPYFYSIYLLVYWSGKTLINKIKIH